MVSNIFSEEEGKYWYISTIVPETGRLVVLGEYPSKEEADRDAFSKINGAYEVFGMRNKDRAEATRHAKYLMFKQGAALEHAVRRAKHQV